VCFVEWPVTVSYERTIDIMFVYRFPNKNEKFFLRLGSGEPILNVTKEVDCIQKEFGLPSIVSSNVRHVVETLKSTRGLEAASSAGIANHYALLDIDA